MRSELGEALAWYEKAFATYEELGIRPDVEEHLPLPAGPDAK